MPMLSSNLTKQLSKKHRIISSFQKDSSKTFGVSRLASKHYQQTEDTDGAERSSSSSRLSSSIPYECHTVDDFECFAKEDQQQIRFMTVAGAEEHLQILAAALEKSRMELQQAFAERATKDHLVQSLVGMLNAESVCTADVENKSCSDWDILQMQLKQLLQRLHEKEVEVAEYKVKYEASGQQVVQREEEAKERTIACESLRREIQKQEADIHSLQEV